MIPPSPIKIKGFTFILTSPALGGATSTVSMVTGFFGSHATAALQMIGCKKKVETVRG